MKELIVDPIENTHFGQDCLNINKALNVNGKKMPLGYWNLMCNIRDLKMYANRIVMNGFDFDTIKKYYGVKQGGVKDVTTYLETIYQELSNTKN